MSTPEHIEITSATWPEVEAGADLVSLLTDSIELRDGDVVVISSKVVSKAEGNLQAADRRLLVETEAHRIVARRADTVIAETRHGVVLAAAGVDASNTPPGTVLTLPADPDATARSVRDAVWRRHGVNVAVVVSDTAGRAWRTGQTDLAIGCAGLEPVVFFQGRLDTHGNALTVTAPALADEVAAAADLVKGKVSNRPLAVLRGLAACVAGPGDNGSGAGALVRPADEDLFGLGAREAATAAALRSDAVALGHFPRRAATDPPPFAKLAADRAGVRVDVTDAGRGADGNVGWHVRIDVSRQGSDDDLLHAGALAERVRTLAVAHRLVERPPPASMAPPGWRTVDSSLWVVA